MWSTKLAEDQIKCQRLHRFDAEWPFVHKIQNTFSVLALMTLTMQTVVSQRLLAIIIDTMQGTFPEHSTLEWCVIY